MGEYLITTAKGPSEGLVSTIIDQLQHGLGYSAYQRRDQLRKDDQLLRNRACELLIEAKKTLQNKASSWRKVHLVCTREQPVPSPENLAIAKQMDDLIKSVSALETQIRNAAMPENSSDWQKHRQESTYLPQLQLCDTELLQVTLQIRDLAEVSNPDSGTEVSFREALDAVSSSIRKRQGVFSGFLQLNVKE